MNRTISEPYFADLTIDDDSKTNFSSLIIYGGY